MPLKKKMIFCLKTDQEVPYYLPSGKRSVTGKSLIQWPLAPEIRRKHPRPWARDERQVEERGARVPTHPVDGAGHFAAAKLLEILLVTRIYVGVSKSKVTRALTGVPISRTNKNPSEDNEEDRSITAIPVDATGSPVT
ncbi:hypothetical protein TNCV_3417511 [Trichonephila clavipes]|nr:hypothetical protein TNCV_3417511 [Trichonephila clavipes]